MPRSVPYKESNNRFAAKWMKNALRSVGITTKDVLTEIAPNTSEFVSTGAHISRDIFGVLTRNRQSIDRVNNALSQNKYSKAFQAAYKNALSDIKTGNLNNQERMMEAFGGDEGGFSFGDDDQQIQIDTGTSAALSNLGNQMAENTAAQIKMMKASTDAMISANAAAMFQNKQIGSEIISKLTNIDNKLASIVEFNNTNMSKYIESSIAYFERTGSVIAPTEQEKKKLGIGDVLRGNSGFDARNYKKLVTQQFKEYFSGTTIGQINELLTPDMLNMLAANPIGFMSKALVPKLMPAMMAESLKAVEDSFNEFLPQALMNLYANTSRNTTAGIMGEIIRGIGETFGIKPNDRKNHGNFDLKGAKIERGPIPFDGETKHAITTVITKELRDQTSYLRVIAEHFDRNAVSKANGYKTFWDWNTNTYVGQAGVDKTIANTFTDAIAEAFDNTTFGKTLRELANTRENAEEQKRLNEAINQLYTLIERTDNNNALGTREIGKLVGQLSVDRNAKRLLNNQLTQLYNNNNLGYYSVRTGKVAAGNAITGARERMLENPNNYNLIDSSFNREMTPEEFDALIDQAMGYNEHDKSRGRAYRGMNVQPNKVGNMVGKFGKNLLTQGSDYAVRGMIALATGNTQALKGIANNIMGSVGNVLKDTLLDLGNRASVILFGTKNEKGKMEDGLFSSVINETKDAILGKENTEGKREGGIVGGVKSAFNLGLNGWMESLFGKKEGETDEEMRKRLKGEIEARMPQAAKGAVGGALIGGLLGHPFIGAALGGASGLMFKSESFQNWLFGDIDPEHPEKGRTGGLISKEIQDYFRKNKKDLAKNTGVGAAAGGIMGMFVGGPITGAMLGAATGLISKTGMFQRFLFGDEKTGHKGLINGVREAFGKGAGKYTDDELKSLGMKGIGAVSGAAFASFASAHGLLGAMMFPGGPVGGAIAGLALTIKAQEGSIKEWLFGKKDKDGKIEKVGVLGTIANNINTAIINPLKTELKYHIGNLFNRIEHHVLTPISLLSQFVAKRTVDLFKTGTGLLATLATAPFKLLNNMLGGRLMDLGKGAIGLAGGVASGIGRAISAPGRAVMNILGAFDPDLYAQGLGAKASFRENREAIKQGRKAERRFDKIDREISKATKGRYGEDTPEAREYIRRTDRNLYNKLFVKDGKEVESRQDVNNKANIEKEGRRLSQLFAKGDKGKVNVNAMSLEERQTYYMYKQTEYLRRILGNQEKEEEDHEDFNPLDMLTGSERSANLYGYNAGLINETYDRLIDSTRGTGLRGVMRRRLLKAQRKAQLKRAANRAFNEPDSDSAIGRAGNTILNKVKGLFSGQGGRGAEEDDDYLRWQHDQKNKYDKDGKTAAEMKKEKEEKQHDDKVEASLAIIAENTGGLDGLVEQEDGSKKRGIFGALSNLVSGFGGIFGKKGVFTLAAVALAPTILKYVPDIIKGLPSFITKVKDGVTTFINETWPKIKEGINWVKEKATYIWDNYLKGVFSGLKTWLDGFHTSAENKPLVDEDSDGQDDLTPSRTFRNTENGRSLSEGWKTEMGNLYNVWDPEDGTITNTSSAKVRAAGTVARKAAFSSLLPGESKATRAIKHTANVAKAAGAGISGYFGSAQKAGQRIINNSQRMLQQGLINADDYEKVVQNTVKKYGSAAEAGTSRFAQTKAGQALGKAGDNIASAAKAAGTKLTTNATGDKNLLGKVLGYIDDLFKGLATKADDLIAKIAGTKGGQIAGKVGSFTKGLKSVITRSFDKIAAKINGVLGTHLTGAAISAGLTEVAFVTFGAIEGLSGTAKLFHVDSKAVDGTMRAISAIFGGISQTLPGAIADVCFQLYYAITGNDILSEFATLIYNTIKGLSGDTEAAKKLDEARAQFHEDYIQQREDEVKLQYESQLAMGVIPADLSYEDFCKGVEDGTYSVKYDSEADYNTKRNASITDKALSGLGTAWHSTKTFIAGNGDTYEDKAGNVYTKGADGFYTAVDANGKAITLSDGTTAKIDQATIDRMKESGEATVKDKSSGLITRTKNNIVNTAKKLTNLASDFAKEHPNAAKIAENSLKIGAAIATGGISAVIGAGLKVLKAAKANIIYRPIDNVTNYYKLDSDGKTYSLYNGNDNLIEEGVLTLEEMKNQLALGTVFADNYQQNTESTANKQGIEKAKTALNNLWTKGINGASSLLATFDNWLNSGDSTKANTARTTGGNGGRGVFYSQNDSRWKNSRYGSDGATMGDSGCGPTALAMAMSDTTGRNISPTTMAGLAEMTGDRDSTGTNWNFIGKASDMMGVGSRQAIAPSAGYLASELARGNEVVLSGRSGGYGGRGVTPYTKEGHYVVATGIDHNGNVTIKDPKGGMGKYDLRNIAAETGSSWSFGGRGVNLNTIGVDTSVLGNNSSKYTAYNFNLPTTNSTKYTVQGTTTPNFSTKTAKKSSGGAYRGPGSNTDYISGDYNTPTATYHGPGSDTDLVAGPGFDPHEINNEEYQRWLDTIAYVKEYASKKQGSYDQGGSVTVTTQDGTDIKMRTDCSGFVSACLMAYGAIKNSKTPINSQGFTTKDNFIMSQSGFIAMDWPDWDNLLPGDIIARQGHVEIFAENVDGKHKVWNWGSGSSAASPGTTYSSHPSYTTVWRHPNAANGATIADASGDSYVDENGNKITKADSTANGASINGKAKEKKKVGLLEGIGNFFSAFTDKLLKGDMSKGVSLKEIKGETEEDDDTTVSTYSSRGSANVTNKVNYTVPAYHGPGSDTDFISGDYNTPADNVVVENDSVSTVPVSVDSISGSDNKSVMYKTLRNLGLSPVATAGILGNFHAESGIKSARFEGDYSKLAKSRGGLEGIFADHGSLNDYTTALVNATSTISDKERALNKSYRGKDGNLYPGLGLAQWTGPRAENLINYANSKGTHWTDASTQAEFLTNELTGSYSKLMNEMNELQSPTVAAEKFLDRFEMGSNDGWHIGKEAKVNMDGRRQAAEAIYGEFGGAGYGGRGASVNKSNLSSFIKDNLIVNNNNATVGGKLNQFGLSSGVSKTLKRYAVSEEDIANMLNYMKVIADNTGLSANSLSNMEGMGAGGTTNNMIVAGNGQAPLSNYSTKADSTANAKSKKNYQTIAKVATGGVY